MKITFRLIVSLVLAAALVASVFSYVQVQNERDRFEQDLDVRAELLAESLQESVKELLRTNAPAKLKRFVIVLGIETSFWESSSMTAWELTLLQVPDCPRT